jgi:hypothetical protein
MTQTQRYEAYIKACIRTHLTPIAPHSWINCGEPQDPREAARLFLAASKAANAAAAAAHTFNTDMLPAGRGDTLPQPEAVQAPNSLYDDPRRVPEYPQPDQITMRQWCAAWRHRIQTAQAFARIVGDSNE